MRRECYRTKEKQDTNREDAKSARNVETCPNRCTNTLENANAKVFFPSDICQLTVVIVAKIANEKKNRFLNLTIQ